MKKRGVIIYRVLGTTLTRRETELLDVTIEGKAIKVVFDIVEIGPKKDMILGTL